MTEYINNRIKQLKAQLGNPEVLDQKRIEIKLEAYNEIKSYHQEHLSLPCEEQLMILLEMRRKYYSHTDENVINEYIKSLTKQTDEKEKD